MREIDDVKSSATITVSCATETRVSGTKGWAKNDGELCGGCKRQRPLEDLGEDSTQPMHPKSSATRGR